MKRIRSAIINTTPPITIREKNGFIAFWFFRAPLKTPASHGLFARIHERHPPWFGEALMHFHAVVFHVESNVRHVKEVVRKILLDHITFVTTANYEVINPIMPINLHYVPEYRLSSNLHHSLR